MPDLTFLTEVVLSIAAVALPIGLILWILVAGDVSVADLFMVPRGQHSRATVVDEEPAPRWRPERLRPRADIVQPVPTSRQGSRPLISQAPRVRLTVSDDSL